MRNPENAENFSTAGLKSLISIFQLLLRDIFQNGEQEIVNGHVLSSKLLVQLKKFYNLKDEPAIIKFNIDRLTFYLSLCANDLDKTIGSKVMKVFSGLYKKKTLHIMILTKIFAVFCNLCCKHDESPKIIFGSVEKAFFLFIFSLSIIIFTVFPKV